MFDEFMSFAAELEKDLKPSSESHDLLVLVAHL